ncbi:hypothetical protein, partial [Vibrio coralliilyticus]|uniref:hypothetical protein n=1 Tax=Vibrio coralliilyticus TaxID=190893 RepID=UPI001C557432
DWPSGVIELKVKGKNQNNVDSEEKTLEVTYDDTESPEVVGDITFDPLVPVDGQKVKITVNFSELVTGVTATVGGVNVTFTGNDPAQQWVGETAGPVTLSSNEETITAVVNAGYKDLSDNTANMPKSTSTAVKPIIIMSSIDDLSSSTANAFVVSGTARGFTDDT